MAKRDKERELPAPKWLERKLTLLTATTFCNYGL